MSSGAYCATVLSLHFRASAARGPFPPHRIVLFICGARCAVAGVFVSCAGVQREMNCSHLRASDSKCSLCVSISLQVNASGHLKQFCPFAVFVSFARSAGAALQVPFVYDNRTELIR